MGLTHDFGTVENGNNSEWQRAKKGLAQFV